jgi:hypothetical protein
LLALSNAGALSAADLEAVIDRALLQFDGRVTLDDVRSLLDGGLELPVAASDHPSVH